MASNSEYEQRKFWDTKESWFDYQVHLAEEAFKKGLEDQYAKSYYFESVVGVSGEMVDLFRDKDFQK